MTMIFFTNHQLSLLKIQIKEFPNHPRLNLEVQPHNCKSEQNGQIHNQTSDSILVDIVDSTRYRNYFTKNTILTVTDWMNTASFSCVTFKINSKLTTSDKITNVGCRYKSFTSKQKLYGKYEFKEFVMVQQIN